MTGVKLPGGTPEPDIKYVRRITLSAKAQVAADRSVEDLTFHLADEDDNNDGFVIPEGATAEQVIADFVDQGPSLDDRVKGPLDFAIAKKCYVVIKLEGDFWEFDLAGGVTTKQDQKGRYYRVVPHSRGDRIIAVSFCAKSPERAPSNEQDLVSHAINLHIDFLDHGGENGAIRRLPVIVDPDVENRGG